MRETQQSTVVEPHVSTSVDTGVTITSGDAALDATEARELTSAIRFAADALWVLLARAKDGRAWEALGHPDWRTYVDLELGMSRSRSYQLLGQNTVNAAVEAASGGIGLPAPISEAAARDLHPHLAEVTALIEDRTGHMSDPATVTRIVAATLDEVRQLARTRASGSTPAPTGPIRPQGSGSDYWYTPRVAVTPLLPSLPPPPARVWCPADVDGRSHIVGVLREQGYEVVCTDVTTGHDFLKFTHHTAPSDIDFVVTNPPYSLKKRWIEQLSFLGIRQWALLLPETGLGDWGYQHLEPLGPSIGIILMSKRISYSGTFAGRPSGSPPFSSLWLLNGLTNASDRIMFRPVPDHA